MAQTDFGDYVRARAADAAGAADVAAAGYGKALATAPDDQILAMRAYRQALAAGDYALAGRAAAVLVRAKTAPPDTEILAFAIALHGDDRLGAEKALERMSAGPLDFMAPVLGAWLAFDRGEDPTRLLDTARGNALATRFAERHRVLLTIASGREGDGIVALAALLGPERERNLDRRSDAGIAFARAGSKRLGRSLLGDGKRDFDRWRKRVEKAGKPDAAFGASRLFLGLAEDISGEDMAPLSILLARTTLLLDPGEDRARLLLAAALSESGSDALALATLGEVAADGPFAHAAAAARVEALRTAGRTAEALKGAEALAKGPDATSSDAQAWGDTLADAGRYDEAAAAYAAALARAGARGGWQLHYLHGAALDRAGRWSEALPALRKAVELGPDEAPALTYLGYAQVTRGEDLSGAQALLERAHKLKPEDSAIADSLAWALYKRGEVAKALPLLEKASRADPGGARVNEHLGDAYWKLGRHYEARYAWRAAVVYADNEAAARLEAKLARGLD